MWRLPVINIHRVLFPRCQAQLRFLFEMIARLIFAIAATSTSPRARSVLYAQQFTKTITMQLTFVRFILKVPSISRM